MSENTDEEYPLEELMDKVEFTPYEAENLENFRDRISRWGSSELRKDNLRLMTYLFRFHIAHILNPTPHEKKLIERVRESKDAFLGIRDRFRIGNTVGLAVIPKLDESCCSDFNHSNVHSTDRTILCRKAENDEFMKYYGNVYQWIPREFERIIVTPDFHERQDYHDQWTGV